MVDFLADKFVVTRGKENVFVFTIKANGAAVGMEIVTGDTFTVDLVNLADGTVAGAFDNSPGNGVVVTDALNGEITLTIPALIADTLVAEKGSKADRYYQRPVYKLIIDCVTQNNGHFITRVPEVYVD